MSPLVGVWRVFEYLGQVSLCITFVQWHLMWTLHMYFRFNPSWGPYTSLALNTCRHSQLLPNRYISADGFQTTIPRSGTYHCEM